jgi:hypothetical protein
MSRVAGDSKSMERFQHTNGNWEVLVELTHSKYITNREKDVSHFARVGHIFYLDF